MITGQTKSTMLFIKYNMKDVLFFSFNIFIMRVYRRNKWDVTHSLTPKPEFRVNQIDYSYDIPELPERKAFPSSIPR